MGIVREQLHLAKAAGVKNVLIVINMMDVIDPSLAPAVFNSLKESIESSGVLKETGFYHPVMIIPCSVLYNTNISVPGMISYVALHSFMHATQDMLGIMDSQCWTALRR